MKTKSLILGVSAAGALLSTPAIMAQSAVSDPVGYKTDALAAGFNLISPNLSRPLVVAGGVDAASGSTITDDDGAFVLDAGVSYTIQFSNGLNSEIVSSTATTINTVDDVSAAAGTTFEVRETPTLSSLFGDANSAGLIAGNGSSDGADVIWVPSATGFDQYFYNGTAGSGIFGLSVGWKGITSGNDDQAAAPVYFTDGIFVQRFGASTDGIVFTGHVITGDSEIMVSNGFNFVGRVLPVEVTLGNSGLESDLTHGNGNADGADIVWIPNDVGGFDQFFYNGTAGSGIFGLSVGWKGLTSGNDDQAGSMLSSGFVIQNQGSEKMVTLAIPSNLDI